MRERKSVELKAGSALLLKLATHASRLFSEEEATVYPPPVLLWSTPGLGSKQRGKCTPIPFLFLREELAGKNMEPAEFFPKLQKKTGRGRMEPRDKSRPLAIHHSFLPFYCLFNFLGPTAVQCKHILNKEETATVLKGGLERWLSS